MVGWMDQRTLARSCAAMVGSDPVAHKGGCRMCLLAGAERIWRRGEPCCCAGARCRGQLQRVLHHAVHIRTANRGGASAAMCRQHSVPGRVLPPHHSAHRVQQRSAVSRWDERRTLSHAVLRTSLQEDDTRTDKPSLWALVVIRVFLWHCRRLQLVHYPTRALEGRPAG